MPDVLNLAAYRFVPLDNLDTLRGKLAQHASACGLKGTILLAEEGINIFIAGQADQARGFMAWLGHDARLAGIPAKESWSDTTPFRRMRVRIKREIIRMNQPAIQPHSGRAPAVDALTLNRWLDQGCDDNGRPVVMLDTRNAFEVACGTFHDALEFGISRFSEFPQAIAGHRDALRDKTIVSFCTGGIRCEKAAIVMRQMGLAHSFQLEGGILKYFEETDARHFRGECFVFDERIALEPSLAQVAAAAPRPATRSQD
jgi:UPF0176 protein